MAKKRENRSTRDFLERSKISFNRYGFRRSGNDSHRPEPFSHREVRSRLLGSIHYMTEITIVMDRIAINVLHNFLRNKLLAYLAKAQPELDRSC